MEIDLQKVLSEHKKWIESNRSEGKVANLQGADLRGADLQGAKLQRADLRGANLLGAYLRGADLQVANLQGADLRWADMQGADMQWADLQGANLYGADLRLANLDGANLDEMYRDIPVTLAEVRDVILSHRDRLNMGSWHGDDEWHNGKAKPVDECGTAHCIAGWAHHLAALRRPELLSEKANVYLVGRLALGEEAAEHFFDDSDEALEWLESLDV